MPKQKPEKETAVPALPQVDNPDTLKTASLEEIEEMLSEIHAELQTFFNITMQAFQAKTLDQDEHAKNAVEAAKLLEQLEEFDSLEFLVTLQEVELLNHINTLIQQIRIYLARLSKETFR